MRAAGRPVVLRAPSAVFLLAAVGALGALLRFSSLGTQSYWYDEAITVGLVHKSLGGMLAAIPSSEATPPLYYIVAWAWTKVFGTGEAGLRSLSALFGVATIPVAFSTARIMIGRRAGLAAAALVAL